MVRALAVCSLAAAVVTTAGGCATRATAYRFRAPLVAGVAAPEIPASQRAEFRSSSGRRLPAPAELPIAAVRPKPPKRVTGPLAALYALVGDNDGDASDLELVFRALDALDVELADDVANAADGAAFVAAARARNALTRRSAALGDLVVFDGLQNTGPASLVGVVTATRDDGTVEFIYRGLGVVRRGYLNLEHPTRQRDRDGRINNTWLRVARGRHRKGLAGDSFATYIRLDRLSR